jgi:hypothetical protein
MSRIRSIFSSVVSIVASCVSHNGACKRTRLPRFITAELPSCAGNNLFRSEESSQRPFRACMCSCMHAELATVELERTVHVPVP